MEEWEEGKKRRGENGGGPFVFFLFFSFPVVVVGWYGM